MSHEEIVKTYSDRALSGIVRQLSASGDWPARLRAARAELQRRTGSKTTRRPEDI